MKKIFTCLICAACVFSTSVFAQAIDNATASRNIDSNKYFRINYENDYFAGSDRDYTQGILVEKVKLSFARFPLSKLLWRPKNSIVKYGIALEDDAYTPNDITSDSIEYGDRPYAADLFLKTFLIAVNDAQRTRISISLSTGIIGPWAGGKVMQSSIHRWINYKQPEGWGYQISNDAVLNYQVDYEKELFSAGSHFSFALFNSARVGTLSDKASTGIDLMAGNFYSPYKDNGHRRVKKFQWYAYGQPLVSVVGYDATLQSGVFDHTSPYTIPAADINRFTLQYRFGFVIIFKKLYLEYYRTGLSKEFTTSVYHKTGGIEVGFGF